MSSREPRAVLFGCAGPALSAAERAFFRDADPAGFILFQRNCVDPPQVRALVASLRESIGRAEAPVLIDQEGGRVARLKPPHCPAYPAAAALAALGGARAEEAVRLAARLIGDDLAALGITVDCLPVLDIPTPGAHAVIGDRAYGDRVEVVTRLGRAACEGLLAAGVLPVLKHMPGHGRAAVDSHDRLPLVETPKDNLEVTDFAAFRAMAAMPWGMTAHIVYAAIDRARPATLSPLVIREVIRASIGFDGVLVTDDLSMRALGGSFAERARAALSAGCDLVLHCNGDMKEMIEVADATDFLTVDAARRLGRGEASRTASRQPFDRAAAGARFRALLAAA